MRITWPTLAGSVLLAVLPVSGARAQAATRVDLDNDAFNFWQAPNVRADREYTQGFRIATLHPDAGALARRLLGGPNRCDDVAVARDCRMLSVALTQAMYTPSLNVLRRAPGERPFAGWLGAELGVQRERSDGLTAFSVAIGLTGRASLAEDAQKMVHRIFNFPPPQGWDAQIPSELAVVASYTGAVDALRLEHAASGLRLHLAPTWTVRAGTLVTDATAGAQLTLGLHPPTPWQSSTSGRADHWGLYARGGLQQSAVAHNLFLDGSTFGSSAHVSKNAFVSQADIGLGVRSPLGMVEWQVHARGREYRMQPTSHAYSTLSYVLR